MSTYIYSLSTINDATFTCTANVTILPYIHADQNGKQHNDKRKGSAGPCHDDATFKALPARVFLIGPCKSELFGKNAFLHVGWSHPKSLSRPIIF